MLCNIASKGLIKTTLDIRSEPCIKRAEEETWPWCFKAGRVGVFVRLALQRRQHISPCQQWQCLFWILSVLNRRVQQPAILDN